MADRVLFISWGSPVPGREEHGLEVFEEALGLYGRMQQDGRIESFDVVLLAPNASLGGYMELRGSAERLAAVREDEQFRRMLVSASLVVEDLQMVEGSTDAGIAGEVGMYREAIARVPQAT